MKDLNSKLFKQYDKQRLTSLSKIIGGQVQGTEYDNGQHCGHDTIDRDTKNGPTINLDGVMGEYDFVDLTAVEIISTPPQK